MTETLGAKCGFLLIGLFSVAMGTFVPAPVSAQGDELRQFEAARQAYTDADYAHAVQLFELLVGGPVPSIQNAALVLESRKYLGAAYLFVGRPTEADAQFEALLVADPDYLIPASFPEAVHEAFESTRRRLAAHAQSSAEESARLERERREAEMRRLVAQQERIHRLEHLASLEIVERENSRALALLPFGIGQFQNEDARLGRILAYSEAALALVSLGTAIARIVLRDRVERVADPALREPTAPPFSPRLRRTLWLTNWTSFGALSAIGLAGIIQAQVRFRPTIRHERPRALPDESDLGDSPQGDEAAPNQSLGDPASELVLGLGPGHVSLTLHF